MLLDRRPLTALMPTSRVAPAQPIRSGRGVSLETAVPPGYVWPDVARQSDSDSGAVILVSAPGAMGKTVAAEALSATAKVPHLDLSRVRVGSGTFTGELGRFFGMAAAGSFIESLVRGDVGMIIDGLDEAQLRSGSEHFFAFMEDVAESMEGAAHRGQIVMLGRPDAISGAEVVLENYNVSFAKYKLCPLDYTQATKLIDASLDAMGYTGHRDNGIPFGELRDAVLNDLGRALTGAEEPSTEKGWERVSSFLGYPPVLEAIGRRLAVRNPKHEYERVKADPTQSDMSRGELLVQVAQRILDRETEKVRENLPASLGLSASDPMVRGLYTREEQIIRLVARLGNFGIDPIPPVALDAHVKAAYEKQVSGFLADHPFLRGRQFANIVFADYCRAFVVTSETIESYGVGMVSLVAACADVGPFFAHFVHALSRRGLESVINEGVVDDVLRSFQAEDRPDRSAIYAEDDGEAMLALAYSSNPSLTAGFGAGSEMLLFVIQELSGALELSAPLARCTIVSDSGVVLRPSGALCELGPSVVLSAPVLEVRGDRLVALGPRLEGESVVLLAAQEWITAPGLEVTARPADALSVLAHEPSHPWAPYAVKFDEMPDVSPREFYEGIVAARRILSSFGRALGAAPARNMEFIDRIIVGAHETGERVLAGLIDVGVVKKEAPLYRLDLSVLGEYGVSYAALRDAKFEEALAPLVKTIFGLSR